jgi:hypothetical protein
LKYDAQRSRSFQFLDFLVELTGDRSEQERARGAEKQPELIARFVILGPDANGNPSGRVYMRRFKVVVESWLQEVAWEQLALGGLILAIVAIPVLASIRKKRKRPRRRPETAEVPDESPLARPLETDYFHGMESAAAHQDLGLDQAARPEPPQPKKAPATPAEPSYLDGTRAENDTGGPSYLD